MGVWPMICKIPPYYQFRRSSSKSLLTNFIAALYSPVFIFSTRWFGPSGGGGDSLDARRGNGRQAPLQFHQRCAAGDTVAFHLSLLVVEGVLESIAMGLFRNRRSFS